LLGIGADGLGLVLSWLAAGLGFSILVGLFYGFSSSTGLGC